MVYYVCSLGCGLTRTHSGSWDLNIVSLSQSAANSPTGTYSVLERPSDAEIPVQAVRDFPGFTLHPNTSTSIKQYAEVRSTPEHGPEKFLPFLASTSPRYNCGQEHVDQVYWNVHLGGGFARLPTSNNHGDRLFTEDAA